MFKLKKEILIKVPVGTEVHVYGGPQGENDNTKKPYQLWFPSRNWIMMSCEEVDEYCKNIE